MSPSVVTLVPPISVACSLASGESRLIDEPVGIVEVVLLQKFVKPNLVEFIRELLFVFVKNVLVREGRRFKHFLAY